MRRSLAATAALVAALSLTATALASAPLPFGWNNGVNPFKDGSLTPAGRQTLTRPDGTTFRPSASLSSLLLGVDYVPGGRHVAAKAALEPFKEEPPAPVALAPFIDQTQDGYDSYTGFPDPRVVWAGDYAYLFGTSLRCFRTRAFETSDLTRYIMDLRVDPLETRLMMMWGFTPYRHTDGSWHAYATCLYESDPNNFKLSHFVPDGQTWGAAPVTSWRLQNHVLYKPGLGLGLYETNIIVDDDSSPYFIWNENRIDGNNHIMARRMTDAATLDPAGPEIVLLSPEGLRSEDRNPPGGMQLVEGSVIQKIGGKWVLIYSVGDYNRENYKIGLAYSDTLIPPDGAQYAKLYKFDEGNVWENPTSRNEVLYLMQTQQIMWPNYLADFMNGPGIGSIVKIDGKHHLIFHARPQGMMQGQQDGWDRYVWKIPLVVQVGVGSSDKWIQPDLDGDGTPDALDKDPLVPQSLPAASPLGITFLATLILVGTGIKRSIWRRRERPAGWFPEG